MTFEKGHKDLVPKESRIAASKKMLGNNNGFTKGFTPWNKGKPMSEEQKIKLSKIRKELLNNGLRPGNYKHGKCRKKKNGKPYSHFVWCSQPGNHSHVPEEFVIHHLDFDPYNNNPSNLMIISRRDHTGIHARMSKIMREENHV